MNKREASFQIIFNQYLRKKKLYGVFELKQTTTNSISFKEVKPHQREGLLAVTSEGFVWKLSDLDPREKPFDTMSIPPIEGYIVIKYPKLACVINIYDFLAEEKRSTIKSLSKETAQEISLVIIEL